MTPAGRVGTVLSVVVCSAWPLAYPIGWYARQLSQMRANFVLSGQDTPEWLRAQSARTNGLIMSLMTRTAVKFVIVLFLLSIVSCVFVELRRKKGVRPARVVTELVIGAFCLVAYEVLSALIRSGMDLSRLVPSPPEIMASWSVLAAGLSFFFVRRRTWPNDPVAA